MGILWHLTAFDYGLLFWFMQVLACLTSSLKWGDYIILSNTWYIPLVFLLRNAAVYDDISCALHNKTEIAQSSIESV